MFWNKEEFKFISFKLKKIAHVIKHLLQKSYLVQFGVFVGKDGLAISLGVVVIHKHKCITTRNETPRLP